MDLQTKMTALGQSLSQLMGKIRVAADAVRPTALLADNTEKLEGKTLNQVRTQMDAAYTTHLTSNNPHGDTAASVGIPLKSAVDSALADLIPTGILPISRFGAFSYLPVGIAGSYESGTFIGGWGNMRVPVVMERDGTLVFLRNATDGATRGVYYSYLPNARTASLSTVVHSNRRYRPAFLPADMQVVHILAGSNGVLIGIAEKIADSSVRQLFITLTGGTMDDALHTGGLIPTAVYNPVGNSAHVSFEPVLSNNVVYLITSLHGAGGGGGGGLCQLTVRAVSVSDLLANTVSNWDYVTGWNVTGVNQQRSGSEHILLANKIASSVPEDDAMFIHPGSGIYGNDWFAGYGNGANSHSEVDDTTGKIRTVVYGPMRINHTPSNSITQMLAFSLVIDPVAKTAVLDAPYQGKSTITVNAGAGSLSYSNPAYRATNSGLVDSNIYGGKNIFITEDGWAFHVFVSNVTEQTNGIYRTKLTNVAKPYDYIPALANQGATSAINMVSVGPGPIMNGFRAANLLPNGYLRVISKGTGAWKAAVSKYKNANETPQFSYKSVSGADMVGYSPKSDRRLSEVIGGNQSAMTIAEINEAGVLTSVRMTQFWTGTTTRPQNIDENLITTGDVTLAANLLENAGTQAYAAAAFPGSAKDIRTQLIVPGNTDAPPVFIIWALQPDGTQCNAVFLCSLNSRQGTISSLTLGTLVGKYVGPVTTNSMFGMYDHSAAHGAVYCKMPEGYAVMIGGMGRWARIGSSTLNSYKFFVNTDGSVVGWAYREYAPEYNVANYFGIPGLGPGLLMNTGTESDFYTKLYFHPYGNTKAGFVSPPSYTRNQAIVILSQQVATGWNIYFTEPTPVFIAGKSYTLDVASVDLTTITANPENKKFFVYVQLMQGVPKYVIRETEISDSDTTMYIGYINTTSLAIDQIVIDKVDRIGMFRVSTSPIGAAIPASAGHPSQSSPLSWI